jgi:glutamate 5-kinase
MANFQDTKRIVIKIGSSLVTNAETKSLRLEWLDSLIDDIADLRANGKEIIIVTSGAVALGRSYLQVKKHKLQLAEKQAAAACGQIELIKGYKQSFLRHNVNIAQILLTIEDSENRQRFLNARSTLETLLKNKVVPVINENDSVAVAELRFGDNDRLAARVAQMMQCDLLILLSDIDGLYSANPNTDPDAKHLGKVEAITQDIVNMAGDSSSSVGTGGMITKIAAATIATSAGCHMVIAKGILLHPIKQLWEGGRCTWFMAKSLSHNARKSWILSSLHVCGELVVNICAEKALLEGSSLLPIGVVSVTGNFSRGDNIRIVSEQMVEIGKGISAYSAEEAALIIGRKTGEIEKIMGSLRSEELIHRDDLVMRKNNE